MRKRNQTFPPKLAQTLTWLLAVGAASFLTACSSTHIRGDRTAAGASASPCRNIMVVALDDRAEIRTQFESDLVYFLQQRKVAAVGNAKQFTLSDFTGGAEQIKQTFATARTEAVLCVRTTDRSTFERGPGYETSAGLGEIETAVQLQATLYRLSDGMPIWNGVISTILKDQYNSRVVLKGVARDIVSSLAKDKVVP